MAKKYSAETDAMVLIGALVTSDSHTVSMEKFRRLVDAKTTQDFFELSSFLACVAAGWLQVVTDLTDQTPNEVLVRMAASRPTPHTPPS